MSANHPKPVADPRRSRLGLPVEHHPLQYRPHARRKPALSAAGRKLRCPDVCLRGNFHRRLLYDLEEDAAVRAGWPRLARVQARVPLYDGRRPGRRDQRPHLRDKPPILPANPPGPVDRSLRGRSVHCQPYAIASRPQSRRPSSLHLAELPLTYGAALAAVPGEPRGRSRRHRMNRCRCRLD